jgi:acid stress chaperone HdeB
LMHVKKNKYPLRYVSLGLSLGGGEVSMTKLVVVAVAAYFAVAPAYSQVTIDVSKITCKQFLTFSVADPRDIAIWLSGYYHGKEGNALLQTQELKDNYETLKKACFSNSGTPVMQVIEKNLLKNK